MHCFIWKIITYICPNFNFNYTAVEVRLLELRRLRAFSRSYDHGPILLIKLSLEVGHGCVITSHYFAWRWLRIHSLLPMLVKLVKRLPIIRSKKIKDSWLDIDIIEFLSNLTFFDTSLGNSAAGIRAIAQVKTKISWYQDFTRSGVKTSYGSEDTCQELYQEHRRKWGMCFNLAFCCVIFLVVDTCGVF